MREAAADSGEKVVRVDAVVVGKRDNVCSHVPESDVSGVREAKLRSQMEHLDVAAGEDRFEARIVVLVDDDRPQLPVLLRSQGVEQPVELLDTAHRRDDEVERRKLRRHGP